VRTVNVSVPSGATGSALVSLSAAGDGTAIGTASLNIPSIGRVGTPTMSWVVRRGRYFRVLGVLTPPHRRMSRWVVLRFERLTSNGWVFVKNTKTYSYNKASGSPSNHYAVRTRLLKRGFYRVRAFHPADANGPDSWSGFNWFHVR
jgi:hypothetical protein